VSHFHDPRPYCYFFQIAAQKPDHTHTHTHTQIHRQRHVLTLAVCPVVGGEDGQAVGGAVATQAGAEVAAERVVAGGVWPADVLRSQLTLVLVWVTSSNRSALVHVFHSLS